MHSMAILVLMHGLPRARRLIRAALATFSFSKCMGFQKGRTAPQVFWDKLLRVTVACGNIYITGIAQGLTGCQHVLNEAHCFRLHRTWLRLSRIIPYQHQVLRGWGYWSAEGYGAQCVWLAQLSHLVAMNIYIEN